MKTRLRSLVAAAPPAAMPALMLAAVVVAVWAPSLPASFQFDDWSVIVGDPRVATLAAWWQSMPAIRPLTKLVHAVGHELGGAPAVHRAFNVLLHALNTALVFSLTRRLARRMRTSDPRGAAWIGACTAVVFGLHPVQTEAVTYIAGGSVVLMTSCALGSLAALLRAADSEHPWGWSALSLVGLLGALAARETAAVLPLACLLWWYAEGTRRRAPRGTFIVLGAATLAAAAAAAYWTAYPWLLETSLRTRAPLQNLLAQGEALFWLFGQLVRWDRLNADPALVASTDVWLNGVRVMLLAALLLAAIWQWRRRRWLAFGVLWFFLWLAPTNSLIARLDLVNDRHLYLALLGPAWLLAQLLQRLQLDKLPVVAALALLLATGTALRNRVYADEVVFWQDVVAKSPHSARAANNLGMAHAAACQPLAAARAFEQASQLAPSDPRPRINLELLARSELPGVPSICKASPPP